MREKANEPIFGMFKAPLAVGSQTSHTHTHNVYKQAQAQTEIRTYGRKRCDCQKLFKGCWAEGQRETKWMREREKEREGRETMSWRTVSCIKSLCLFVFHMYLQTRTCQDVRHICWLVSLSLSLALIPSLSPPVCAARLCVSGKNNSNSNSNKQTGKQTNQPTTNMKSGPSTKYNSAKLWQSCSTICYPMLFQSHKIYI